MKTNIFILFILSFFISVSIVGQNDSLKHIDSFAKQINHELRGTKIIPFSSKSIDGSLIDISKFQGKVILLNFWFIGCPPCMGEVPDLNKIDSTYRDSDFVLISLARDDSIKIKKFIAGMYSRPIQKINYTIIPNASEIENDYKITGHPTSIFIDKKGIIRLYNQGASIESLNKYVEFYGEKKLSKGWKKIYKESKNTKSPSVYQTFSLFINELLAE